MFIMTDVERRDPKMTPQRELHDVMKFKLQMSFLALGISMVTLVVIALGGVQ